MPLIFITPGEPQFPQLFCPCMVQLLAGIISLRRVLEANPGCSHGSADTLLLRHSANCKSLRWEVNWDDWKSAFLSVSNKHAPIKTSRLKVRSNPWMTSDIVKLMYKRDRIHNLAVKRKDDSLMDEYRKLRNSVTDMIKNRKKEYFTNVSNSSCTKPRSFWEELSSIIPKINVKSIPRNMNAEDFNIYFKNVPDLISSSFAGDSSLLWRGQESKYTFKFIDVQRNDLINLLLSLSDKTGMDILGFDRRLVRLAGEHIVDSLLCIINDSLSNGTFPDDWKLARVTPVYKNNGDVNIMSNYRPISVIGHIAKMVEQLVRLYHIWRNTHLSHQTSLPIWKVTLRRLVCTVWLMTGWRI